MKKSSFITSVQRCSRSLYQPPLFVTPMISSTTTLHNSQVTTLPFLSFFLSLYTYVQLNIVFLMFIMSGDPKEKRYFVCKTSYTNNNASNPAGYWKPIIKNKNINTNKLILATGCNHPIGFKNSFIFYQFSNHRQTGLKTPWILHQFRLLYPLPIKVYPLHFYICKSFFGYVLVFMFSNFYIFIF